MGEKGNGRLSKRNFLQVIGYTLLGAGALAIGSKYKEINQFWAEEGPLITGDPIGIGNIATEVPPQLQNKEIPKTNEFYRPVIELFKEGLDIYQSWMRDNTNLSNLRYNKPDNYLDIPSISERVLPDLEKIPNRIGSEYWAISWALEAIGEIDRPYEMIVAGSTGGITSLDNMIQNDPGTGFVNELREVSKKEFGTDFDIWEACRSHVLSDEQKSIVENFFQEWYQGALTYIQDEVKKDDKPISTSVLFSYFLFRNDGNILKSVWDTSSWLKITARNDISDLKFNPNNDKAKLITSLFKDEFAKQISANWVVDNVDTDDEVLNSVVARDYYQYKDFMPPNRAGFYHPWNIIGLGLHMSPFLLRRIVASHLMGAFFENDEKGRKVTEYGHERITADWEVAENIQKIVDLVGKYD